MSVFKYNPYISIMCGKYFTILSHPQLWKRNISDCHRDQNEIYFIFNHKNPDSRKKRMHVSSEEEEKYKS